jgi:hypothetical protein
MEQRRFCGATSCGNRDAAKQGAFRWRSQRQGAIVNIVNT